MEMTKWQFMVKLPGEELDKLCEKGWEPFGVNNKGEVMLKRPKGRFLVDEIDRKTGRVINSVENDEASYDRY